MTVTEIPGSLEFHGNLPEPLEPTSALEVWAVRILFNVFQAKNCRDSFRVIFDLKTHSEQDPLDTVQALDNNNYCHSLAVDLSTFSKQCNEIPKQYKSHFVQSIP